MRRRKMRRNIQSSTIFLVDLIIDQFQFHCNSSESSAVSLCCCCSVAKSCPTLRPHGLQHAQLPCPPLSPSVCSDFVSIELVMLSSHVILCHPHSLEIVQGDYFRSPIITGFLDLLGLLGPHFSNLLPALTFTH